MKKTFFLASLFVCGVAAAVTIQQALSESSTLARPAQGNGQTPHIFKKAVTKQLKGNYLLHLPESYSKSTDKWPLILFLHGSGERGGNIKRLRNLGVPLEADKQKNFPFIVLSPHCPAGRWWTDLDVAQTVMAMLEDVCKKYRVDRDRIYLTGLSMGGAGTWYLAHQYPQTWAAVVPVCGWGDACTTKRVQLAKRLKDMPIQIYHGAKDPAVSVLFAHQMAVALNAAGNRTVRLFVYPNARHNVWSATYAKKELYAWLLSQKRKSKTATPKKKTPKSPAATTKVFRVN